MGDVEEDAGDAACVERVEFGVNEAGGEQQGEDGMGEEAVQVVGVWVVRDAEVGGE